MAADIDGDGRLDPVTMSDASALYWYRIPGDPTGKWKEHRIGPSVHGGIAPRGVGDLDGDGQAAAAWLSWAAQAIVRAGAHPCG